MQKFITDDAFWDLFPECSIAVLSLENVQEKAVLSEEQQQEIAAILKDANEKAKVYVPNDPISANEVPQVWRKAYQKFPTKKGARCSLENLLKRVLHGTPVGSIAPSVDITNAISLKYAFPIGVENMDAFAGEFRLGIMKGDEDYLPIGEDKPEPPLKGELAYYDDKGVVCRCWNWRDGQRTEVNDDTTSEVVIMECIQPERIGELKAALDEVAELMTKYLGAKVITKTIVDKDHREAVLRP